MFNVKWGAISAIAGFALAFVISLLLGHTRLPVALLRGAGFGALFFGLGGGIWGLINIFIPELLVSGNKGNAGSDVFSAGAMEMSGSNINITIDDTNAAIPDASPSTAEEVGDFNDLVSGAIQAAKDIDQNSATSYTTGEELEKFTPAFDNVKVSDSGDFSMDFSAFVPDSGESAESDSFMESFSFFPDDDDSGKKEELPPPERKPLGNKNAKLEGDFDAREIAAGLRTVLEKDKKG